jgi:hypothetical protein
MKKRNKDTIRSIEYICFIFLSTLLVFHPTIRFVRHNYIFLNVFPTRRFCLKLLVAFPSNQYLPTTIFWPFLLLSFVFFSRLFFGSCIVSIAFFSIVSTSHMQGNWCLLFPFYHGPHNSCFSFFGEALATATLPTSTGSTSSGLLGRVKDGNSPEPDSEKSPTNWKTPELRISEGATEGFIIW